MSKTVLGRGLGSLLGGAREGVRDPVPDGAAPSGVQLLLRGADGSELVPEVPVERGGETFHAFPRWALGGAVLVDLALAGVAVWLVLAGSGWGRYVAATVLLAAGCGVLSVAVWLRGQPAVRELESLNPLAEEKPRLRVQFMDELPRRRE